MGTQEKCHVWIIQLSQDLLRELQVKWKVETSNDGPQMCLLVISQSEVRMVGIFGSDNDLWGGFPGGSVGKEFACNVGDLGSISGLGRSPGEGHGNLLQYSCLENPYGQRTMAGYSPRGHKESDMTVEQS